MKYLMCCLAAGLVFPSFIPGSTGQEKKKRSQGFAPKVIVIVPLAAAPGATTKLIIRGLNLEGAKEIRCTNNDVVTAKIISKGKAKVPDKNPDKVGDTQLIVEITLPADLPSEPLSLVVITAKEESKPHKLIVEGKVPVVAEKEPNDGFKQAMPIKIPQVVTGSIDRPTDVDVFRFEGKKGQKVEFEVVAARYGSALDAMLTLYDSAMEQLASNNAGAEGLDAILTVTLPRDGVYYLEL